MKMRAPASLSTAVILLYAESVLAFQNQLSSSHRTLSSKSLIPKHGRSSAAESFFQKSYVRSTSKLVMSSDATAADETPAEDGDECAPLFESIGKGILRDYKARLPLFVSDVTDGLNIQVRGRNM